MPMPPATMHLRVKHGVVHQNDRTAREMRLQETDLFLHMLVPALRVCERETCAGHARVGPQVTRLMTGGGSEV